MNKKVNQIGLFLSLFMSASTLFCCALPALFVLLGAGAVFASFTSAFPHFIILVEYKNTLFVCSAVLLGVSKVLSHRYSQKSCDIQAAAGCAQTKTWTNRLWLVSCFIYGVAAFFSFVLPMLMGIG